MVRLGQKEVTNMKARRYELADKEWELIRPLIPISHTGRPQKDIRAHLNGILWLARSGARWSDLPARFGPHQTVYSCFCRWRDDGTLKKIFELCAAPGTGAELSVDSTSIKASVQAGHGIRKRAKIRHQAASAKHAEVRTRKFMPSLEKTCGLWLFCCLPEMLTIARRQFLC